jgi:TrmH family RNA methyltransferase
MITSTSNQHVAYCRSLHRSKSRREAHAFLVEGLRSVEEALDSASQPLLVLFNQETLESSERGAAILRRLDSLDRAYDAAPHVIEAAAATKTPAGIVMVMPEPPSVSLSYASRANTLLILDGIADAGNAGTILRTAAAAGLSFVVFAGDTVDPFSAKTIRSAMGAHFHVHVLQSSWADLTTVLSEYDQVVGTSAGSDATIYDVDWTLRTAVIIGSEAHGLGPSALDSVSQTARIPMAKDVESLNAAAVAAVTLFEAKRARERAES